MVRLKTIGIAVLLAAASTAAYAFQEQQAPAATQAEPNQAAPAAAAVPLTPNVEAPAKGTPVRIPGLGTLGVIPKMDFGLELLYGAAETNKRADPTKPDNNDDVLVGGRIKHKF